MNSIFTILFAQTHIHCPQTLLFFVYFYSLDVLVCAAEQHWLNDYYYYKFICFSSQIFANYFYLRSLSFWTASEVREWNEIKTITIMLLPTFAKIHTCLSAHHTKSVSIFIYPNAAFLIFLPSCHPNTFNKMLLWNRAAKTRRRKKPARKTNP